MKYSKKADSELSVSQIQVNKHRYCRRLISLIGIFVLLLCSCFGMEETVYAMTEEEEVAGAAMSVRGIEILVLSSYEETMNIGETRALIAASTSGASITYKSSDSSVASVDMYGFITAKKAGTCQITAKTKGAESSCKVTVLRTTITLNSTKVKIENGATFQLTAKTSSGNPVTWKSSKKSVAIITDQGLIQAVKPGESIITVTADGSTAICTVEVMQPGVTLTKNSLRLYRDQTYTLKATVTSNKNVTWKSSRPSVAVIDEYGKITAIRHGETRISATVDGVTRYCTVTVASPTIRLNKSSISIKKGKKFQLKSTVSSGKTPTYKCSSTTVATVSKKGLIKAKKKGTCTITVSEDGATAKCKVKVTG